MPVAYAVGLLALAPKVSWALELGEATVRSGIGQPLVVGIPYRLAPGEQLAPACIGLRAMDGTDALPTYSRVSRIAVSPTHIEIVGSGRILDPLISLTVDVRCPTAPNFARRYELLIDLPGGATTPLRDAVQVAAARPVAARAPLAPSRAEPAASTGSVSARARGQSGGAVEQGQTYVVVRGDTLSGIASRVADRRTSLRETAEAIFAANPDAFTRGNRDLLEAGRSIVIPALSASSADLPLSPAEPSPQAPREAERATAPSPAAASPAQIESERPPAPVELPQAAGIVATADPPIPATQADAEPRALESPLRDALSVEAAPMATALGSRWLTALLALGIGLVLATPLLLVRRLREKETPPPDVVKRRPSRRRTLKDPAAGFDVVEGQLTGMPSRTKELPAARKLAEAAPRPPGIATAAARTSNPLGIDIDAVDIDVGTPVIADERVDWFADSASGVTATHFNVASPTLEDATARMPEIESAATARLPAEPRARDFDATIDDEHHTLTIVELDMLRQDYEAEHTLTQESNKALRDALAELKATQASRAATVDTATAAMPQPAELETAETRPTPKLRSSRKA